LGMLTHDLFERSVEATYDISLFGFSEEVRLKSLHAEGLDLVGCCVSPINDE